MLQHGFANRVANTQPRVQRAVGILKYQLHPRPYGAQGRPGQVGQLLTVKFHAAGALLVQAKQGSADGGFAAAGLTHQAKSSARTDVKADAVHRAKLAGLLAKEAVAQRKILLQSIHFNNIAIAHAVASANSL